MEYIIIGFTIAVVCAVIIACIGICVSAQRTLNNLAEIDRKERDFKRAVLRGEMRLNDMRIVIEGAKDGYVPWSVVETLDDLTNEEFDNWYEQYLSTGETTIEI